MTLEGGKSFKMRRGRGLFFFFFFFFCFSPFKMTKICFGSTKMEKHFTPGKKSGKMTLPPQKTFPVRPLFEHLCSFNRCAFRPSPHRFYFQQLRFLCSNYNSNMSNSDKRGTHNAEYNAINACVKGYLEPTHLKSSPLFTFSTKWLGQDSPSIHLFSKIIRSRFTTAKIKLGEDSPSWFVFSRSRFAFKQRK